jgi:serine/threonine protein kinase
MNLTEFRKRYRYDPSYDKIGEGGFAKVYKARDMYYNRDVALKFYYGSLGDRYSVQAELDKVVRLDHPNLIKYYGVETLDAPEEDWRANDGKVQVGIMEYANGGDLDDFMTSFPTIEAIQKIAREILEALAYLHDNHIIHRDIKPQNILMHKNGNTWTVKIADFGLARQTEDSHLSSKLLGTVEYIAPEQLDVAQFGINGKLSTNVDLWGLGIILAEIFTGETPFGSRAEGVSHEQVMFNVLKKDSSVSLQNVVQPYRDMINWCLRKHATERVQSAHDLLAMLDGGKKAPAFEQKTPPTNTETPLNQTTLTAIVVLSTFFTPIVGLLYYLNLRSSQPLNAQRVARILPIAVICWVIAWSIVYLFAIN